MNGSWLGRSSSRQEGKGKEGRGKVRSNPAAALETGVEDDADRDDHANDNEIAVARAELGHMLEVHAVDAGDGGRHGKDRRPGRQLPGDGALPLLLEQSADFEHA